MKNVDYLVQIMKRMPDVRLHWYGGDGSHPLAKLPNVDVTGWVHMTPDMAKKIVNECDIFVNVSNSDANPTTLLEVMAWGIITACTKESGYWKDPLFTELYLDDLGATIKALRDLLETPGHLLRQRAAKGRVAIETKYTWDRFCQTIWNELEPHLEK